MMAATKSMIALGLASAVFIGTPGLSLARTVHHHKAHSPESSYGAVQPGYGGNGFNTYGAYGAFGARPSSGYGRSYNTPDGTPHRSTNWDPYGQRFDDDN